MNLSHYNGKRIALVMEVQGREVVLRGTASLRLAPNRSHILQVTVDDDGDAAAGNPVFLITEQRWTEKIVSGISYDCDYCLDLATTTVAVS